MEPGRTYLECHLGFVGGDDRDVYHAGHNCTTQETKAPGSSVLCSPAAEARDRAAAREMREHAEPARRQPAIHSALANRMTHPTERGALHQQKEVKGAGAG